MEIEKHINKQWEDVDQLRLEDYDEKEQKQLEQQYKKKADNARVIKTQLYDFKVNTIKRFKEEQLEGEIIKRQVYDD